MPPYTSDGGPSDERNLGHLRRKSATRLLFAAATALVAYGLPHSEELVQRQSNSKLVFCHFMIGVVSNRDSAAAYDNDMQRAKARSIDALALTIGTDN
ncbi:hypothetical protein C8R43DRAFT_1123541 [Mycena crocata]|nr:hypothetical protein C8R43DRAFT_1123541 [Mycena crocata]